MNLVVQWLRLCALNAGGLGQGTRDYMLQLRCGTAKLINYYFFFKERKGEAVLWRTLNLDLIGKGKMITCFKQVSDIVRFAFQKDYLSCNLEN